MIQTHVSVQIAKDALGRSIILRAEGKYEEALENHFRTKELMDNPFHLRRWWAGVGRSYRLLGKHDEALDAYNEALRVPATDGDKFDVAGMHGNLANVLIDLNRSDEAIAFLESGIEVMREGSDKEWLGIMLESLARAYLLNDQIDKALLAGKEALDILWFGDNNGAKDEAMRTLKRAWEAKQIGR